MSSRWSACGEKGKIKKRHWTVEEDIRLLRYIKLYGDRHWSSLGKAAGLQRCGRSCRMRWVNYLRPGLKHTKITPEEESIIIDLHGRWSQIAERIPGRTDNEIKNYCRTHLKKKLQNLAQSQNIVDQICSPNVKKVQDKQVALPRQSLEGFMSSPYESPLSYENNYNHALFDTETPMERFTIEEVIRDMETIQEQVEAPLPRIGEVEGSIQNGMEIVENFVELTRTPNTFSSKYQIESYAREAFKASYSISTKLTDLTHECESDLDSDILLWTLDLDTSFISSMHSIEKHRPFP